MISRSWFAVLVVATSSAAAPSHCDPSLAPSTNHPFAYAERGDRCEGVYIQAVSGSTLALLSFTAESRALDPSSGRPLMIDWPAPPAAREVQLRALSMRRRLFYRMDTRVPASNTRYVWPTEVLSAMDLKRAEIGLLGWTRSMVGGIAQDVFLPLTASQGRPAASTHLYTFVVRPGAELSEVFLTVTRLAADGGVSRAQQPARELGYGYYPAENPIEITIDAPAEQGLYAVHLGAKLRSGGASTLQFVFQAPGR